MPVIVSADAVKERAVYTAADGTSAYAMLARLPIA